MATLAPGVRGLRARVKNPGVCQAAGLALALSFATPAAAQHHEGQEEQSPGPETTLEGPASEGTLLNAPPVPELPITEAFRIRLQTFIAPEAGMGSGDVTTIREEMNARATVPVNDKTMVRVALRLAESPYDFQGDVWGSEASVPDLGRDPDDAIGNLDLHTAQIELESAYRLSRDTHWLAKQEEWSAIGALYTGSRWEDGAFHSGLDGGGALGVGYEIPERLRLALGVTLHTPLEYADIDVGPFVLLRWRPVDWFTLRTRKIGLQAEFVLTPTLEAHLAGFRSTDRYRLNDREPLGDLTFRDRQVRVGAGLEWTLSNWLHLMLEGGAILDHNVRIQEEDHGTLLSSQGNPSGYFEVHFEVRL
jgi:hypothetical protein